jgi:hypothetical protein
LISFKEKTLELMKKISMKKKWLLLDYSKKSTKNNGLKKERKHGKHLLVKKDLQLMVKDIYE